MTRREFIGSMQDDLNRFDIEMSRYQEVGELPEDLEEGDWYKQWLAFITS